MEIDKERYKRNILLPEVGEEGQPPLAARRGLAAGAGGLGSPVSLYLAAAGVGTIGIADFDRVDVSNLQRQILYREQDIGKAKAELAAEQLQSRNHSVQVELYPEGITAENAEEILAATEVMAPGAYDFRGCICLVDCYNFLDQIGDSETIDRQLKHCNLAVLTKVDLVDSEQIEQVKDKVREINPVCPITESANGNIDRSFYDMDLMLYKWAECEDTTNSSKNKPKTFSMDFTGEIQKEKLEAFLARIEPDVFRVKGFFKVEKEGWEKVDVVGKKRDYAPYEPQPKSQLVFISKIGIALIREIAAAWEECVGLPMKLNN